MSLGSVVTRSKPLFRPGFSGFSAQKTKRLASGTGGGGRNYSANGYANSAPKSVNDELLGKAGTNYDKVVERVVNPFGGVLSVVAYAEYKMTRPLEDHLAEAVAFLSDHYEDTSSESEARVIDAVNAAVRESEARIIAAMEANQCCDKK